MKPLLIVGLDPGTTLGLALLDISGGLVKLGSFKNEPADRLIKEVIGYGIPVIVGCDKAKPPAFVKKFAILMNARLVAPKEDLKVSEKQELVNLPTTNSHERDALASALYALKKSSRLISKLNKATYKLKNREIVVKVYEQMLKDAGINISETIRKLSAKPLGPEKKQVTQTTKQPIVKNHKQTPKAIIRELRLLRQHNTMLKAKLAKLRKQLEAAELRFHRKVDRLVKKRVSEKETTIVELQERIKQLSHTNQELLQSLDEFKCFVSAVNEDKLIARVIPQLTKSGFKAANFKPDTNQAFVVENPNEFSGSFLKKIENSRSYILVVKKPSTRLARQTRLVMIPVSKLKSFKRFQDFAIIDKKELSKLLKAYSVFYRIIEQYKNSC